jgi:glutathione-regulated potassium-efflux system ancillary protein KefG
VKTLHQNSHPHDQHLNQLAVWVAHPTLEKSVVNGHLLQLAQQMPGVEVVDLYETYPNFMIDVAAEQAKLVAADVIILQYPFYWYSPPALLKQWLDNSFGYGFAYGEGGTALQGKYCLSVISAGGSASAYQADGKHGFSMWQLMAPMRATAAQCGLTFLPPAVIYETARARQATQAQLQLESDYLRLLRGLQQMDLTQVSWQSEVNLLDQLPV